MVVTGITKDKCKDHETAADHTSQSNRHGQGHRKQMHKNSNPPQSGWRALSKKQKKMTVKKQKQMCELADNKRESKVPKQDDMEAVKITAISTLM